MNSSDCRTSWNSATAMALGALLCVQRVAAALPEPVVAPIAVGAKVADGLEGPLVWAAPEALIVVDNWDSGADARAISGSGSIALEKAQILFVPVERGQWTEIESDAAAPKPQLGFATGSGSTPDAIVWEPVGVSRVYVPSWSKATHIAVRSLGSTRLNVHVSARPTAPVDWFLWDGSVADWARSGADLPRVLDKKAPDEGLKRILQLLDGLRDSLPPSQRQRAAPLLLGIWLEESLRVRPLSRPFFVPLTPNGTAAPRVLIGPSRQRLDTPSADVHRWQLRALGAARLLIREGGAVARIVNWSKSDAESNDWTSVQSVRTIANPTHPYVELEVLEGTVSVSMQAWAYRPEFRELFVATRRQRGVLTQETSSLGSSLRGSDPVLEAYSHYAASLAAKAPDTALHEAAIGLERAPNAAWRALFTQRLFDLAVEDEPPEQRARRARADSAPAPTSLPDEALSRDSVLTKAVQETMVPARSGRRPSLGDALEAVSRASPGDPLVRRIATKYWQAHPFRGVPAPPNVATRPNFVPLDRQGDCNPAREGLEAWLLPPEGLTDLSVDLEPGVYAMATLRPISEAPQSEGVVWIDGIAVSIHAAAGLSSRIALAKGRHRVRRSADTPPFAIETTEGMTLPCSHLYRWQRLTPIGPNGEVPFVLPSPGASTVARVSVDTLPIATQLWLTLGARQHQVSLRPPATGDVDVAIEPRDDVLGIRASRPIAVALSMRRELEPKPEPTTLPLSSVTSSTRAGDIPPVLDSSMLAALEDLGRRLRSAADDTTRSRLRRDRADLLMQLGFSSLALRDVDALPSAAETRSDLVRIADATEPVLPVGLISTIAPLALPESTTSLLARRKAWQGSDAPACALDVEPLVRSPLNAETLLAAYCAERAGLAHAAARLFERIARPSRHGSTMLHAALLMADAAVESQDRHLGLDAALLGAWSANWGQDTGALRSRLASAIQWVIPSVIEGAAGVALLAHGLADASSPRQLLLTRLVAAPEQSLVLEDDKSAELLVNSPGTDSLEISSGCDTAQLDSTCTLRAWLDNAPADCVATGPKSHCRLTLPAGKHRIRLAFDGAGTVGWVQVRLSRQALRPIVVSSWTVLEKDQVARLTIKGPTVLQVRSRGSGRDGESISVNGCNIGDAYEHLNLPTGMDAGVRPWPIVAATSPLGNALDLKIPVQEELRCSLQIVARQPHTLVQVALARAVGLPKPRIVPPAAQAVAPAPSPPTEAAARVELPASVPRRIADRQPLLIGARGRFVSESLAVALETDTTKSSSEGAFQDVYGELSALASRELVANRWWGTLQAGTRLRNGPSTEFARISYDLPPQVGLFGVDLVGSVYSQSFGDVRTTTYFATGKLSRLFPLTPKANLLPQVGFTTMRLGAFPGDAAGVDGDVYSNFYASHPRYASLATTLALRPFVDTLTNLSLSARSLPELNGFDRLTATLELMALPVPSWPVLGGIDWMSSYRPANEFRAELFVRHDLGVAFSFWHWLTPSERIRCFGRFDFFFDAPAARLGTVIIAPTIGLEITSSGTRGLRDLSPQQAPFREFQERGSGRVRTGRVSELEEPLASGASQ